MKACVSCGLFTQSGEWLCGLNLLAFIILVLFQVYFVGGAIEVDVIRLCDSSGLLGFLFLSGCEPVKPSNKKSTANDVPQRNPEQVIAKACPGDRWGVLYKESH